MKKKKSDDLMSMAKQSVGLGIMSGMAGGIMGGMASIPGAPAQMGNITSTTMTGMNLLNIGQMGKIGMALPGMMGAQTKGKKKKGALSKWM